VTACQAVISFRGPQAGIIIRSLSPEAGRGMPRVGVFMTGSANEATVTIEATDTAALRAALNSYLRWADVAMKVSEEVGK